MMAPSNWLVDSGLVPRGSWGLVVIGIIVLAAAVLTRRYLIGGPSKSTTTPSHPHHQSFPPSRRHALASITGFEKSQNVEIPPAVLNARALPTTRPADVNRDNQYTPTGFSTQEIRKLGRFPDYATLSGVRPPVPVDASWDITKATFRPYRPFRWNYHQHMALMKFEPDWWIELERNYVKTMKARHALLAEHRDRILFESPGSELAVRELMEMLLQFLVARYPAHFSLSPDKTILTNRLLNTTTDLSSTPPLRVLFDNVPEDYAIMLRNETDGIYHLRAAMVCSSVGWHIGQHRDAPLRSIHTHVPDADKMAFSMDRFFSKMATDAPVNRCSWSIEDWEAMFTTPEIEPAGWSRSAFAYDKDALRVEHLKLRCDAQTLRRLPLSGAIVFNFKAIFTPLEALRTERYIPALLLKVLREGKDNLIEYKCEEHVRQVSMKALEEWAREQTEAGLVPADWEVGTLDESPFFPGWEDKWKAEQGML
ncbi:hypothetical protein QBC47DRAFT_351465 [Echria macrotheca]|uniref:Uncharacterized protein n=1 Tax=Echria macrotheca TaxID=438768 RepID=A0AAJ0B476_9PEZI|nr:hypothetical protein QBC47DRAFT_351465 [Echria macrotheca]